MNDQLSRIAVLEANQKNTRSILEDMRADMADHENKDDDRFTRQFIYMGEMKKEIIDCIGELKDELTEMRINKIDPLWDEKNQRGGAFKLSGIIGHCITALVTLGGAFGIFKVMK